MGSVAPLGCHARLIQASSNGDRWLLAREGHAEPKPVVVVPVPDEASGGITSRTELGAFHCADHKGPEHAALLHLIGTLVGPAQAGEAAR